MKRFIILGTVIFGSTFVEGSDFVETFEPTPSSPITPPLETSPTKHTRLEVVKTEESSPDIAALVTFCPLISPRNSPRVPSPLVPKPQKIKLV